MGDPSYEEDDDPDGYPGFVVQRDRLQLLQRLVPGGSGIAMRDADVRPRPVRAGLQSL
jgi:hypothetical protein